MNTFYMLILWLQDSYKTSAKSNTQRKTLRLMPLPALRKPFKGGAVSRGYRQSSIASQLHESSPPVG